MRNDPETSQAADSLLDDILTDLDGSKPSSTSRCAAGITKRFQHVQKDARTPVNISAFDALCRQRSLAPVGPSSFAARPPAGAGQAARPKLPVTAARPGRTTLPGTAASRLSRALRDVPMLDATVKGESSFI